MSVVIKKPLASGYSHEDYIVLSNEEVEKLKKEEQKAWDKIFKSFKETVPAYEKQETL